MRALREKKGMFANLIIITSVATLLGISSSAADMEQPPFGARSAPRRRASVPNVDPDIQNVVPQRCIPAQGEFIWNFEEEELINVLRQVSDMLCWNIVMNDSINKNMRMTIIGKSPLNKTDARDVLMAALASKGLALIEQGKTWTVIKRAESKNFPTPFYSSALNVANNEAIGTLFYKAVHTTPDALRNIAKMLISKDGIVEVAGEQFIVIIDSNSNIKRLGNFFAQLDVSDAVNKIHVIKLKHADIKTVEKQVRELFDVAGGMGPGGRGRRRPGEESRSGLNIKKIIADDRTNSLIVEADEDTFQKLQEIVNSTLDLPLSDKSNKGKIHVYTMRFGDAKKIADSLNNVVRPGGGRGRPRGFPRPRDEDSNELFEGEVQITAHESSNMLIVVASQNDYNSLLPIIKEMDAKKKQVLLKAAIFDLSTGNKSDFGINLLGGIPGLPGGTLGFLGNPGGRAMAGDMLKGAAGAATAATSLGLPQGQALGALAVLGNFVNGGVLGFVGRALPGTTGFPSFGAMLQALSTNSNVDILSTPYGVTSDNEPFVMKVGKKVPTVKGTSSAGSGVLGGLSSVPLQNIVLEPVELSFKVTPHIGEGNDVRLEIEQEVNELGEEVVLASGNQKIIQTKSIKTTIVLKDQQMGVLGGLTHDKTTKTEEKIPFLGDIPVLGHLFKKTGKGTEKANLLLIIEPHVIETDDDYRKIAEAKLKEREEFAAAHSPAKIKTYNPYVDYDKKSGPLSSMFLAMDAEMKKPENGGPGDGTEIIIKPKEKASESIKVVPIVTVEPTIVQREFVDEHMQAAKPEAVITNEHMQAAKPEAANMNEPVQAARPEAANMTEPAQASKPEAANMNEPVQAAKPEAANMNEPAQASKPEAAITNEQAQAAKPEAAIMAEQDLVDAESAPVSSSSLELVE
jgi:general secretion pathway protein D